MRELGLYIYIYIPFKGVFRYLIPPFSTNNQPANTSIRNEALRFRVEGCGLRVEG